MSLYMTETVSDLWAERWAAEVSPWVSAPQAHPSAVSTCLQWCRDVLVPVFPDHLTASRLQCHHEGPLLWLLLQPVADILGPHRAPEPCGQYQRPRGQDGAVWLMVE